MKSENYVLYAKAEGEKTVPVSSATASDTMAAAKLQHAASAAYRAAESRGVPLPELVCVLEERDSDEAGKLTSTRYTRVKLPSLKPDGDSAAELSAVL